MQQDPINRIQTVFTIGMELLFLELSLYYLIFLFLAQQEMGIFPLLEPQYAVEGIYIIVIVIASIC